MKVGEICTRNPRVVISETTLADAAKVMWEADCGALPVIDKARKVIGMITDRDICLALGLKKAAPETRVTEVMKPRLVTCRADDEAAAALRTMSSNQVRRLPVVGPDGKIEGILSIHDALSQSGRYRDGRAADLDAANLVRVLQAIGESPDVKATIRLPQSRK